ncbi:MAG TPA: methyltransferase domain-containing protein [Polyangia bacterium]|nr:methyltransferase domain-containing protein [Polyangia bacterium]
MPETSRGTAIPPPPGILSSDVEFDSVYDSQIRDLSQQHWTPVLVAVRAAQLLTSAGATRVLDVGSGAGKFCIAGALSTEAAFVGVERRGYLVEVGRQAALRLGADRATFVPASVDSFSFEGFNGVYLYNPFYEQISRFLVQIDGGLERSRDVYRHFVNSTMNNLAAMAPPVVVVTFHGFGGLLPAGYEFRHVEPAGNDELELWVKK